MTTAGHNNITFLDDDGNKVNLSSEQYDKSKTFTIIETNVKGDGKIPPEEEYDPYKMREVKHPITNMDTIIHLLKSSLGTGILAMPNAFNHAGYLVGSISTVIIAIGAVYCIHMLIGVHHELCKRKRVPSLEYPKIAEAALLEGPKWMHKFAPHIIHVTNAFILMCQMGICCVYVVFVAENAKRLVDFYLGGDTDLRLFILIELLPLILINWVRKLKYLAPLSTIANAVTVLSFGIICYYIFRDPVTFEGKRPYAPISEYPLYFGTVLFSLEAIGVIIPLENEMKTPKSYVGCIGVLNQAFTLIVSLYVGLGLFGYLKYGSGVKGSITLNLPSDEYLAQLVNGLLAFGVFITHALACYVAIDLTWNNYVVSKISNDKYKLLWEYVLRTGLVFVTFLLAIAIPELDLFISLFGSLCMASLGLIFPALFETCIFYNRKTGNAKLWMIAKNVFVGLFGLCGALIGTITSLIGIYAALNQKKHA